MIVPPALGHKLGIKDAPALSTEPVVVDRSQQDYAPTTYQNDYSNDQRHGHADLVADKEGAST